MIDSQDKIMIVLNLTVLALSGLLFIATILINKNK